MNSKSVLSVIKKYDMLRKGDRVVVALSGGADSVSLLHVLLSLKDEIGISVSALHVNHGIRGREADRDESFCRELCEKFGTELRVFRVDVPALAREKKLGEEECGRLVRYELLERSAGENGKIATAHNLNDNAETVLLNITRGSGNKGLCGIPPKRGNIIRPLIETERKEIEEYIKNNSLSFVTDSTNFDNEYSRNKIRNEVLPRLTEINPAVLRSFLRLTSIAAQQEEFLSAETDKAYRECLVGNALDEKKLLSLSAALQRRVVRLFLRDNSDGEITSSCVDGVLSLSGGGGKIVAAGGITVRSRGGLLETVREKPSREWEIKITAGKNDVCLPFSEKRIKTDVKKDLQNLNKDLLDNLVDCDKISNALILRSRRAGDKITLRRRGVTKTLKKLFNEAGVPPEKRNETAILADGENVVWVEGFGVSKSFSVEKSTKEAMYISVTGGEEHG